MELLIKLYDDKASKIGIKYDREYQAIKAYEDLLNKNKGLAFRLKIEMIRSRLDLELICEQTGLRTVYKEVEYKLEQLKRLKTYVKPGDDLQFVHIFSKENTLVIAKPFRTMQFVNLKSYEIIGSENFVGGI